MKKITLSLLACLLFFGLVQAQVVEPGVDGTITNLTPADVVVTTQQRESGLRGKNIQATSTLVFFTASDTINSGEELWVTDGTLAGTMMVKDINPGADGSDPKHLCAVGDTVYFSADNGTDGTELWMSDGTDAGTKMVKNIFLGGANASNPDMMVAFKDGVLFRAKDNISSADNDKSYLWWSDGSEAGTNQLAPIQPVIVPDGQNLTQIQVTGNGEKAFFVGVDDIAGQELWVTWGDSTKLVLDIGFAADTSSTIPGKTVDTDIRWLFAANEEQLWFRPYTPAYWLNDTSLLDSIEFLNNEVWVTNGEPWGTYPLGDLNPTIDPNNPSITGNTGAAFPFNYDRKVYYRASNGVVGTEFFSTDLTPGSQTLVKNIHGQNENDGNESSAFIELQAIFDGYLYFKGQTRWNDPAVGLPNYGQELSRYNSTTDSVENVFDIFPGATTNSQPREMTVANGRLYFRANDASNSSNQELWGFQSFGEDPTETPYKIVELPENGLVGGLINFNEKLVFVSVGQQEIYIYDDQQPANVYDPGDLAKGPPVTDNENPRISKPAGNNDNIADEILRLKDYVKVYPNPVSGTLTVELDKTNLSRAGLYDMNGRMVWKGTFQYGVNQIQVSDLPNGTYTLFTNIEGFFLPQRVIIAN